MRSKAVVVIYVFMAVLAIGTMDLYAKGKPPVEKKVTLTEAGKKLEAKYGEQLNTLKAEIKAALPKVDDQKKAAYKNAVAEEKLAKAALGVAQKDMGKIKKAHGLVGHAKGKWIGGADKGIAKCKEMLKNAKTDAERDAIKKELANWEANKKAGEDALVERQALLDKALAEEPQLKKALEAAEKALADAQANTKKAVDDLNVNSFLASDKLDNKLVKFELLFDGTPSGLAAFAQDGEAEERLIENLLDNPTLMKQIVIADGAKGGKYGQAMKIYSDIQKASPKAKEGVLQKLALAISLEHALPVPQRSPKAAKNAPANIDPVKRYLQFEKAYLDKKLDPAFKGLSVWDMRMVVDGNEPDETHVWGREMLSHYRPDHMTTEDYRWRYVASVRTDIRYGSQYNNKDKPELQFFQNILMNGGVCGRRAFFGRFILRSFGIPTTARPQPGHAALAHWTPKGWVVCLGGGWGAGTTKTRYTKDLDFLATTQARENEKAFLQVKRAQWVGDVMGEKQTFGLLSGDPDFWYGVSLNRQRGIIEEAKAVALAAVGEELGEANETEVKIDIQDVNMTEKDKGITVGENGVITIPAASCSNPTKSTGKILFMKSPLGGMQLHYSRVGKHQDFEYTFDSLTAGKYALSVRIANPSWGQNLLVTLNDAKEPTEIKLPLTTGLWDKTAPVEVEIKKGKNILRFSRSGDNIRGLSIKDLTLTPVK